MATPPYLRPQGQDLLLLVHVQPSAPRSQLVGLHGDRLKLKLAAPPVDDKANTELIRFLADHLHLPKHAITLTSGQTSRQKQLRISGIALDAAVALLQTADTRHA